MYVSYICKKLKMYLIFIITRKMVASLPFFSLSLIEIRFSSDYFTSCSPRNRPRTILDFLGIFGVYFTFYSPQNGPRTIQDFGKVFSVCFMQSSEWVAPIWDFGEVFLSLFYFMQSSVRAAHNLESQEGFSSVYFNLYSPWDEPCTIWDLWIIL